MTGFIEKWRAAKVDPEQGELTYRQWGDPREDRFLTHGWWVTPSQWGLGVNVSHEAPSLCWEGKVTFVIEVGPFCWALSRFSPKLAL